jgi:voltage-gated potassium channel
MRKNAFMRMAGASDTITARRAALLIGIVTVLVTLVSGILMRWIDQTDFDNIWLGLWWAVQTVTTVGYGDTVPQTVGGRVLATLVMLTGIGFISVVTAAITAAFIESARRRLAEEKAGLLEDETDHRLDDVITRLGRIETLLGERPSS